MERVVKTLKNGTRVVFDQGKFDSWCVYLVRTNGSRYAPNILSVCRNLLLFIQKEKYLPIFWRFTTGQIKSLTRRYCFLSNNWPPPILRNIKI